MSGEFDIHEVELERIMDQHVISEGSGISLGNLREVFQIVIKKNNEAVKESVQKMIDEAIEQKVQR